MSADRLLTTVLRAYHDPSNPAETDNIFASTNALLTNLNNPLNLSLLTSHFLTARAIWQVPDGLRTCLRVLSIYNTAALHVRRNEVENATLPSGQMPVRSRVTADEWARAVAKGLDDKSERWQHVLVLAGVLMGMEGEERRSLSWSLRSTLENAVASAAGLALQDPARAGPLGRGAVVLALTYAFPLLSDSAKQSLNYNLLLPAIIEAMLGDEGFQYGDFIQTITGDVASQRNVTWRVNGPSVTRLQTLESRPISQNMGPLSRLAGFAIQHAIKSDIVLQAQDDLLAFTTGLLDKWEHCPLSSIDLSVEARVLPPEIRQGPWPMLWQLFKKIMYTVVATLQPIVGRSLLDLNLRNELVAPKVAVKTLRILRNLSFISTRQGASTFQVYTFTYLTSLDIITRYPDACVAFLQETILPAPQTNSIPSPVHQALTLFYLNTAEHFPLNIPTPACESLIITPATTLISPDSWLTFPGNTNPPSALTLELFESAHSCVLSVLSCPQHGRLTVSLIPFYVDSLLASFPSRISPRQFRLAFRTVMQIVSPPYPISSTHPELSETLLEMLQYHAVEGGASTKPLPSGGPAAAAAASAGESGGVQTLPRVQIEEDPPVSEQTTLVLALIDALPYLPLPILEEWLSRTAETLNTIADPHMREIARRRFWDVLVSGEMDVDRAAVGVTWWGTHGGREMVMHGQPRRPGGSSSSGRAHRRVKRGTGFGDGDKVRHRSGEGGEEGFMMSGALVQQGGSKRESKL
ncbi:hypothetical protein F4809DRAFT_495578 [Biscogniauxia mediterranea]|nr:hypothetical protein F4809DRAFT_495578 [Biscogniauxia mediterranea]